MSPRRLLILRWTVTAAADAATQFRKNTGIAALMRALERHGNAAAGVVSRTKAAS
jgi:hypothetical protein